MKKIILSNEKNKKTFLLVALVLPLVLSGCNTMEGAGTDIKQAGKAIERSAESHKECSRPCSHCPHREGCPRH